VGWLALQAGERSVNFEVVSSEGVTRSAALVTAEMAGAGEGSQLTVTVQLSSLAEDMEPGYRQGFGAGLDNLAALSERTMVPERVIQAPRAGLGGLDQPRDIAALVGAGRVLLPDEADRPQGRRGMGLRHDRAGRDGFSNHHLYRKMRAEEAADAWQAGALRWSQVKPCAVAAPGPRAREDPDAEAGFGAERCRSGTSISTADS
jgi:hypothetical protein